MGLLSGRFTAQESWHEEVLSSRHRSVPVGRRVRVRGRRHVAVQRGPERQDQGEIQLRYQPNLAGPSPHFFGSLRRRIRIVRIAGWPDVHQSSYRRWMRPRRFHQRKRSRSMRRLLIFLTVCLIASEAMAQTPAFVAEVLLFVVTKDGFYEVEIFSNKYWSQDQSPYLKKIITAYKENT